MSLWSEATTDRLTLAEAGEEAGYSRALPAHYFENREAGLTRQAPIQDGESWTDDTGVIARSFSSEAIQSRLRGSELLRGAHRARDPLARNDGTHE